MSVHLGENGVREGKNKSERNYEARDGLPLKEAAKDKLECLLMQLDVERKYEYSDYG